MVHAPTLRRASPGKQLPLGSQRASSNGARSAIDATPHGNPTAAFGTGLAFSIVLASLAPHPMTIAIVNARLMQPMVACRAPCWIAAPFSGEPICPNRSPLEERFDSSIWWTSRWPSGSAATSASSTWWC